MTEFRTSLLEDYSLSTLDEEINRWAEIGWEFVQLVHPREPGASYLVLKKVPGKLQEDESLLR